MSQFLAEILKIFSVSNLVLSRMIKWFPANNLILNLDKNEYYEIHNHKFISFHITYWIQTKVYRRNKEYKISWFTI